MSVAMHELFKGWLVDKNLIPGMLMQMYFWYDSGLATERYAVIQPNGGLAMQMERGLSNEYYEVLWLIGAKNDRKKTMDAAQVIIDYVRDNPLDSCLGAIQMLLPTATPMLTEEGRCVAQLSFRIVSRS